MNSNQKGFCLFKNHKKEKDTQPDYNVVEKTGEGWNKIGACWKKTDKNGNLFLSCLWSEDRKEKKEAEVQLDEAFENL